MSAAPAARALPGRAVSLVSPAERPLLNGVQRLLAATLEQVVLDNVQPAVLTARTCVLVRADRPKLALAVSDPRVRVACTSGHRRVVLPVATANAAARTGARQPHRPARFQPGGARRFARRTA